MSLKNLYARCLQYKNATELSISSVSKRKNSNPFLEELSSLKKFDERVQLAEEKFEKLGTGSSRTIFKMDDKMIIKVAHNDKGIAQNLAEMSPTMQMPCTNNVVIADAKGKWVISRFTENLDEKKFKELTGMGFGSFMTSLFYKFNNEADQWSPPRDYEEIQKNPFFCCIAELSFKNDIQLGDLDKPSSYGILDGEVVLRDFGLVRSVFDDYYSSSSSKSSKTKSESGGSK